jgi:hypothetical protein
MNGPTSLRETHTDAKARRSEVRSCNGCGRAFVPSHGRQTHCRPSCRRQAFEARKAAIAPDLFSTCSDAVDPSVVE